MDNKNSNLPEIMVDEAVGILSSLYVDAIKANLPLGGIPTPFLWGPPGVGKSQAVRQIAEHIEEQTEKTAIVTDVRLLLFNPVDLRGIPTTNADKTLAVWLKPQVFQMKDSDDVVNILFLDELSAAPPSVQAAAYQICLDRKVGEHALPKNCIVIAAGNRTTDKSVAFNMPKALCNRLMHFVIQTNFNSWFVWALKHGIDERIIGYLAFDNSKLFVEPEFSDTAFPTPRSWEMVSNLIKNAKEDLKKLRVVISGCVGLDTAIAFETWASTHRDLPSVDEVFKGQTRRLPSTQDSLYAFAASLVTAVRTRRKEITVSELENVCAYIKNFPTDFAMSIYIDFNSMSDIRLMLMKCPSCQEWMVKNKRYI